MNNLSKMIKLEKKLYSFGHKPYIDYSKKKPYKYLSEPNLNGYSSEVFYDIQKYKQSRKSHRGIASHYKRITPMFGEVK